MANIKKYYSPYTENSNTTRARNNLVSIGNQSPQYTDTYGSQIQSIYNNIKNQKDFSYDPQNDLAYRKYADEYRALAGLAVAGNQAQAQDLTGGYGSTYAPEVARQGEARLNEGVEAAMPAFYQLGEEAYNANLDRLYNMYNAAASARDNELAEYQRQADVYNDKYNLANQQYRDEAQFGYQRYTDNRNIATQRADLKTQQNEFKREYTLKKYDVYNDIAANKCADYKDKGNNKGMRKYLNGLVKAGKLTKYMADNLYKQFKYVAPKPAKSSGGSGKRGTKGSGNGNGNGKGSGYGDGNGFSNYINDWIYSHGSSAGDNKGKQEMLSALNVAYRNGEMSAADLKALIAYYKLEGIELPRVNRGGSSGINQRRQMTK